MFFSKEYSRISIQERSHLFSKIDLQKQLGKLEMHAPELTVK